MTKKFLFIVIIVLLMFLNFSYSKELNNYYIRDIIVKGNRNVNAELIKANFSLKRNSLYSPKEAQESMKSLYNLGLFSDIKIEGENISSDSITVIINVNEHPILDKIEFKNNDEINTDDLKEKINILPGTVLPPNEINKAKNKILDMYKEKGFLLAEIQTNMYESKESKKTILEFVINESKQVKIEKISISGNNAFDDKKIKGKMENTKEDRWWRSGEFNESEFYKDLILIEDFYNQEGFLDARVKDYKISYSNNKKHMFIDIELEEGNRYFVGNFYFVGNKFFKEEALHRNIAFKKGDIFNKQEYDLTKYNIQSLYQEEGYLYIQLQEEKTYRKDTVDVTFTIKEGMPAYINKVVIKGNTKTWSKVIRRSVYLRPGDIFRQSLLMYSQRDIMQLNYFDNVVPDVKTNEDGSIDLVFNVQEKEVGTGQVSASAGYSQTDKLVFGLQLAMPNFSLSKPFVEGAGQEINLKVEYGKYSKTYDVGFTEPWFMDTPTLLGFRGYYWWQDWYTSDIEEIRKGFELRLGRSRLTWPDRYFKIYCSFNLSKREYLQDNQLLDDKEVEGITVKSSGFESALSLRISRNSTDLPDFPTKGAIVEYNPTISGYFLGGDYEYIKHRFAAKLYLPIFWKLVLSQSMNIFNLTGSVIGRYDHFLAGGVNYDGVIRGYPEQSFGTINNIGENVGYNLTIFSAELQFPIIERQFYVSSFVDFGNTWASLRDINFADLKTGVGAGAKLLVPMLGLIGVDFAWGLNDYPDGINEFGNTITHKERSGEKPPYFEVHFRIGKPF